MCKTLSAACVLAVLLAGCTGNYTTKEALLQEGTQLLNAGDPGGAISILKNALDRDQTFFEARLVLARAYARAGKMDSTEKELQKLIRLRPNSREVQVELARMHAGMFSPDAVPGNQRQTSALVPAAPVPYPLTPASATSNEHATVVENLRKSMGLGEFFEAAGIDPSVANL